MDIAGADAQDVKRIVDAVVAAAWPLSRAEMMAIGERLGWQVRSDRENGITFRTGLHPRAQANSLVKDEHVRELTIDLNDWVDGDNDRAVRAPVRAFEREVVATVAQSLGGPGSKQWRGRTAWDLDSGARIAVQNVGNRVLLQVLGPEYASIERAEVRDGVDPNRIVGVDPEPA